MPVTADPDFPLVPVLVFISVILLAQAAYLLWRARKGSAAVRLQRRLDLLSQAVGADGQRPLLKQRRLSTLSSLASLLGGLSFTAGLGRYLAQSGLEWAVSTLLLASATGAAAGLALASISASPAFFGLLIALLLGAFPWMYVAWKRGKRLRKLEQQLPDALDLITRAMRAGHSLPLGVQMVSDEMRDPVAAEFRLVHEQISFGMSLQQALASLCERVPLTDYRYFVIAVLIQRQSGGNLTEVLGKLSQLIRERHKLFARVRVLSAEGRMSAWVLSVLPFALGGLLHLFNPGFISRLWTDPLGISMLRTMLAMMALGILILIRIVKIRV
jgi:tight adherence protein B